MDSIFFVPVYHRNNILSLVERIYFQKVPEMSSPELESFKMNEDEIQDMYDPLRKKKKPSKNYNLYGKLCS